MTTRNFPTKKYAADPNAPHPQYYDHEGYYPGQQDFYVGFDGHKTQYGHGGYYGNAAYGYGHGGYYGTPTVTGLHHGSSFNTYGNALYLKEGVEERARRSLQRRHCIIQLRQRTQKGKESRGQENIKEVRRRERPR